MKHCMYLFLHMAVRLCYGRRRRNLELGLCIRRVDNVPNAWIREFCRVAKGVDERAHEGVLQWLSHVERMANDRIAKRVYVRVCWQSFSG